MNLRPLQGLVTLTSVLQRVIVEIAVLYYTTHQTLRRQTNSEKARNEYFSVRQDQENHIKGNEQLLLREIDSTAMLPLVKRRKQLSRIRNRNF